MVAQGTSGSGFPQRVEITMPIKPTSEDQSIFYPPPTAPEPSAPPPPSAPLPPSADVTAKPFPTTLPETLEWARLAVQAETVERDVEKAIKLYDGAIIGFLNYESSEQNPRTRYQYRPYVNLYSEKSDAMKLNLKNMKARQRAAAMDAERQQRRAANTSSSSSSNTSSQRTTTPPRRQYGWDGTLFSGIRKGQYDAAVASFENATLAEARGEIEKARDYFTESASLFHEFQKTEPDKVLATQVCKKISDILTKAESLDARVKRLKGVDKGS